MNGGHPDEVPLTPEEKKAIRALKRLQKSWPASLWLYVTECGPIRIMRCDDTGKMAPGIPYDGNDPLALMERVDHEYEVDQIQLPVDIGDW